MRRAIDNLGQPSLGSLDAVSEATFYEGPHYNWSLDELAVKLDPLDAASIKGAARVYAERAVVVARGIVHPPALVFARRALAALEERAAQPDDVEEGEPNAELIKFYLAYHQPYPHLVPMRLVPFLAPVLAELLNSPGRLLMHAIARSDTLCVQLSHTLARRAVVDNKAFKIKGHQDASVVNPDVRYNVSMALDPEVPMTIPGVGFAAHRFGRVFEPGEEVRKVSLSHYRDLWLPSFLPGDAAFFDNETIHFTTDFSSPQRRWSFEMRYLLPDDFPERMRDWPAIFVTDGDAPRYEFRNVPEPVVKCLRGLLRGAFS